jgi:hypothetical protein
MYSRTNCTRPDSWPNEYGRAGSDVVLLMKSNDGPAFEIIVRLVGVVQRDAVPALTMNHLVISDNYQVEDGAVHRVAEETREPQLET